MVLIFITKKIKKVENVLIFKTLIISNYNRENTWPFLTGSSWVTTISTCGSLWIAVSGRRTAALADGRRDLGTKLREVVWVDNCSSGGGMQQKNEECASVPKRLCRANLNLWTPPPPRRITLSCCERTTRRRSSSESRFFVLSRVTTNFCSSNTWCEMNGRRRPSTGECYDNMFYFT